MTHLTFTLIHHYRHFIQKNLPFPVHTLFFQWISRVAIYLALYNNNNNTWSYDTNEWNHYSHHNHHLHKLPHRTRISCSHLTKLRIQSIQCRLALATKYSLQIYYNSLFNWAMQRYKEQHDLHWNKNKQKNEKDSNTNRDNTGCWWTLTRHDSIYVHHV